VPCRVIRVRPPGQMQEAGQVLEMMPHACKDELDCAGDRPLSLA
jgi:hypothetical protein